MINILHIDTSSDAGFLAVGCEGKQTAYKPNTDTRNQAASINNDISEILQASNILLKDINAIAVCGGPGSYTGLRIGLATAKSICYALDIPLMVHNRLFLMLLPHYYDNLSKYDVYTAILQAREQEYFICSYNNKLEEVLAPKHIFEAELNLIFNNLDVESLTVGDKLASLPAIKNNHIVEDSSIKSESWIMYALDEFNTKRFANIATAEPFYLKQVFTHNSKKIK